MHARGLMARNLGLALIGGSRSPSAPKHLLELSGLWEWTPEGFRGLTQRLFSSINSLWSFLVALYMLRKG